MGEASAEFKNSKAFDEKVMTLLKKRTRNFDVTIKLDEDTYGLLLLDTNEKITRPLEAITEVLNMDTALSGAVAEGTVEVFYGYAAFPKDGETFTTLFSRASKRERLVLTDTYEPEF
jgi:GGDEF domain-containing protein